MATPVTFSFYIGTDRAHEMMEMLPTSPALRTEAPSDFQAFTKRYPSMLFLSIGQSTSLSLHLVPVSFGAHVFMPGSSSDLLARSSSTE